MIYIGIDPGTPLTVCLRSDGGGVTFLEKDQVGTQSRRGKSKKPLWENDARLLRSQLVRAIRQLGGDKPFAVVEHVGPMPGQGIASTCRFVGSMYMAEGLLAGLKIAHMRIPPSVWKRRMKLTQDKEKSRQLAIRMADPDVVQHFGLKKHHDRAEAFLMTHYAQKYLTEAEP